MLRTVSRITLVILSVCFFEAKAQNNTSYFDKLYDFDYSTLASAEGGIGIIENINGNGWYFTSPSLYSSGGTRKCILALIDENGDTVFTSRISDSIVSYTPTALLRSYDDGIAIASTFNNTNISNRDYSLIKYNSNNELEFLKMYGDSLNDEQAFHAINTYDKGFLIVGQSTFPQNSDAEMYAVKTDSAGNFEWEQYYGGSNFEGASSVIQTADSGYLVFGFTQSFGVGQADWYLIKTDKQGDQEWQKIYGGEMGDDIDIGSGIIRLNDNNYLLSGGGGGYGRLIKINPQGGVIWQKNYVSLSGTGGNYLYWAKELPNYSIIAAGLTNNFSESDAGWIIKTDSAGTQLWQRKYNKTSDVELFYDFIPTDDGGFLLCGQARNPLTNNQDAWLLKVDSLGCAYEDCTVGIEEEGSKKVMVDVYPNPANETLTVELAEGWQNTAIKFFDVTGREVLTYLITTRQTSIDVSGFAAGVYTAVLLQGEGVVGRKKIIIE